MGDLQPYEALSAIYDTYWGEFSLRYVPFLEALLERRGLQAESVLDLACGTGRLLAALARPGRRLFGLDLSPQMLAVAGRNCAACPDLTLVAGDFRAFALGREFDLITCCFDAINYLGGLEELEATLSCVRRHLRATGLFAFDAVSETHCLRVNGLTETRIAGGLEYTDEVRYDREARREEVTLTFPSGVERHRRLPLEYSDVAGAAQRSGLQVAEVYESLDQAPRQETSERLFYVLTVQP